MVKVIYNKVCGRCVQSEPLTSGMVGQPIHFEYSHDFDGLAVTAVFTDGKNTVDVVNPGNECIIPHEVLTTVGAIVKVGIYAVRGNELVIPTIYAHIGIVLKGADPSGDVSIDPTLPIWAQTQALIGNLSQIETETKDSLVAAINEVKQTTDAKANAADLTPVATSGSYNDLTNKPTIPEPVTEQTVSGWGFTKNTGTYSKPAGGIPKADLANDVKASLGKADTALQEHQSLAAYRTAEAQNIIDNGKQDKITSTNKLAYSLISGTPTIPTVPTNLSAFTNDAGYLTLATLPKYEGVVE